jgi:hypothetical protein
VEHQHELESGVGVGSRRARGNSFIPDGRHLGPATALRAAAAVIKMVFVFVTPSPKLCRSVASLPYPSSVKEVKTFIGMIQYFALYIPMLAEMKAKLTELTLKGVVFIQVGARTMRMPGQF